MELAAGELTGCGEGIWRMRAGIGAGFRVLAVILRIGGDEAE